MLIQRGDVYYARSAPGRGIKTGGVRPVLTHREQYWEPAQAATVICAAITWQMHKAKLPTHVELNCDKYDLAKDSVVLLEQLWEPKTALHPCGRRADLSRSRQSETCHSSVPAVHWESEITARSLKPRAR